MSSYQSMDLVSSRKKGTSDSRRTNAVNGFLVDTSSLNKFWQWLGTIYRTLVNRISKSTLWRALLPFVGHIFVVFLPNKSSLYLRLFKYSGRIQDLDKAVYYGGLSLLSCTSHPSLRHEFRVLAAVHRIRFQHTGKLEDIDDAVKYYHRIIDQENEGNGPEDFDALRAAYQIRFERFGELDDIDNAILYAQSAVDSVSSNPTEAHSYLNSLGEAYRERFERLGEISDIEDAIKYSQKAVSVVPEGHKDLPLYLSSLGLAYKQLSCLSQSLADIDKAVEYCTRAVEFGNVDTRTPVYLDRLGIAHQERFDRSQMQDLSESDLAIKYILFAYKSAALVPREVAIPYSGHLATAYLGRFARSGVIADVEHSIKYANQAITESDHGNPSISIWYTCLVQAHRSRFERMGDIGDLNEAIKHGHQAVKLASEKHVDRHKWFSSLSSCYKARFDRVGELQDLDNAIKYGHAAMDYLPKRHIHNSNVFSVIGIAYATRFESSRDLNDIETAIRYFQTAFNLTPPDDFHRNIWLYNLGEAYGHLFRVTKKRDDIDKSIISLHDVLEAMPENHPNLPGLFENLGSAYCHRFECFGDVEDGNTALVFGHMALNSTPPNHADLPSRFNHLGTTYRLRFEKLNNLDDQEQAIEYIKRAVSSIPPGHSYLPNWLNNLGTAYRGLYENSRNNGDAMESILAYWSSAQASGEPQYRLEGAKMAAILSARLDNAECLRYFATAVELLTQVAAMHQTVELRHANISKESNLASTASGVAFKRGRVDLALEWLEQGRCLVWNQLNQLRTPIDNLRLAHPVISQRFLSVTKELETLGSRPPTTTTHSGALSAASIITSRQLSLANDYQDILADIRSLPEFHDFLQPPSASEILESMPPNGIVVILSATDERCDGIALVRARGQPLHIPLELKMENLKGMYASIERHISSRQIGTGIPDNGRAMKNERPFNWQALLKQLWEDIALPVITALDITMPPDPSERGRIWWCATGPLSFIPLHAAGVYGTEYRPGLRISDYLVSSYTPTVRSLSDKLKASIPSTRKNTTVAIVGQSLGLPGAAKETAAVHDILTATSIDSVLMQDAFSTVESVKAVMESHSWVHFACHGVQDIEPLKSRLVLSDGGLELREIMQLRIPNPEVALLIACQTSRGDERISNEAVHIAAGMLAAGYRSVVGTMWKISDKYGEHFAKEFYHYLLQRKIENNILDSRQVAYALDHATSSLRQLVGDDEYGLLIWLPYVHYGY